jgi:hypothetical protein
VQNNDTGHKKVEFKRFKQPHPIPLQRRGRKNGGMEGISDCACPPELAFAVALAQAGPGAGRDCRLRAALVIIGTPKRGQVTISLFCYFVIMWLGECCITQHAPEAGINRFYLKDLSKRFGIEVEKELASIFPIDD